MSNYVLSTIDSLYAGMVVPQNIYNADMSLLLVTEGSVLTEARIEQLKRFHDGLGKIYISAETEKLINKRNELLREAPSTRALEDETGYTGIKEETIAILEKISHDGSVSVPTLYSVSEDLSRAVDVTAPSVIVDLVSALASADEYLQRHCINVGLLNGLIGKWLGMSKEDVDTLILVGLLHDCGKASIPSKILAAPRPLTVVEFEVVKTHPGYSGMLMNDFPEVVKRAARAHHEKFNGSGYPDGLAGDKIPLMGRITAVSDIYDAMVSRRSYKNPNSPFKILSVIDELRDRDLDGRLVDVFVTKMSEELQGKQVVLTDGRVASVISIEPRMLEYPVVQVGGEIIYTNLNLSCLSLYYDSEEDDDDYDYENSIEAFL
ncbi:MAG: HD-GYP domain-containing protein [Oscillospiraceae bacterium]|nr:HD-GYP domain-containing protein [Oscillospiraceae bacterium]